MNFILAILLLCLLPSTAFGFGAAGHKLVATIAFNNMTPEQRTRIVDLLSSRHPRWSADFAGLAPQDVTETQRQEWIFQQAAVWPDLIRSPRHGGHSYHRGAWHFIDQPIFLDAAGEASLASGVRANFSLLIPASESAQLNAVQVMGLANKTIHDHATNEGVMLCWLMHLAGDLHQPLHCTGMCTERFPQGDRGGNAIATEQGHNLHSLWDGFPGRDRPAREFHNEAFRMISNRELAAAGEQAMSDLSPTAWAAESKALSSQVAYADEVRSYLKSVDSLDDDDTPRLHLTQQYLQTAGALIDKQVMRAGYRLAAMLKELSKP